jgi:hypothetical protein
MGESGSPYARFRRAVGTGNLLLVRAAAAELPQIGLDDALDVLELIGRVEPGRYGRAAARWVARAVLEHSDIDLGELRRLVAVLEAPGEGLGERVREVLYRAEDGLPGPPAPSASAAGRLPRRRRR